MGLYGMEDIAMVLVGRIGECMAYQLPAGGWSITLVKITKINYASFFYQMIQQNLFKNRSVFAFAKKDFYWDL